MIYFDNSATTLQKPHKVSNMLYNLNLSVGNAGRSGHKPSLLSSEILYKTRQKLCDFFHFDYPENIIFTYNATYALNMAIKGYITLPCTVLTSGYEHNSTIRPLNKLQNIGVKTKIITSKLYDNDEFLQNFEKNIDEDTKFAVINHISNVFGYILPIKEIDKICYKHNIKLILDLSQSAGVININLSDFRSVVAACMPAHKSLYGTMGLGVLIVVDHEISSFIEGGTGSLSFDTNQPDFLPDMLESGTPNIPAVGALYYGIDYVQSINCSKIFDVAQYFAENMAKIHGCTVYFCKDRKCQAPVISFTQRDFDGEMLSQKLAEYNICTRAGYHCSPLAHKTVGTNGTIRASFSSFNTFDEVDEFIKIYKDIVKHQ